MSEWDVALSAEEIGVAVAAAKREALQQLQEALREVLVAKGRKQIEACFGAKAADEQTAVSSNVAAPRQAEPTSHETKQQGSYLYGVVGEAFELAQLSPDVQVVLPPLRLVAQGSLKAIVATVVLADYADEVLAQADLAWLAQAAQQHQLVLEVLQSSTTVVPLRFGTLCTNDEAVCQMLAEQTAVFLDELKRLANKQEWGVKLYVQPQWLLAQLQEDDPEAKMLKQQIGEKSSGAGYMLQKKLESVMVDAAEARQEAVADEAHARLTAIAEETRLNPLQDEALSGQPLPMLLNGAYLVKTADFVQFEAEVTRLNQAFGAAGFEFVMSGPWPAYNFV